MLSFGPPLLHLKKTITEPGYEGWPVLFWRCRVEIITEHGQDFQMFINDQHGRIIIIQKSLKFLGVHITNKLSWSKYPKTVVKWGLKIFGMGPQILKKWPVVSSWPVLSPPGMATARHLTVRRYKSNQISLHSPSYIS